MATTTGARMLGGITAMRHRVGAKASMMGTTMMFAKAMV